MLENCELDWMDIFGGNGRGGGGWSLVTFLTWDLTFQ